MKNTLLALALLAALVSCRKSADLPQSEVHPVMQYFNLHDTVVDRDQYYALDMDGDNAPDVHFHTLLVGDPLLQVDKLQFCAGTGIGRKLQLNEQDEALPLSKGQVIGTEMTGFHWWEIAHTVLAERRTGNTDQWWEGIWKTAQHRYLAVQVERAGKTYNGWVELSIDRAQSRMYLHNAALSEEADRQVTAGR